MVEIFFLHSSKTFFYFLINTNKLSSRVISQWVINHFSIKGTRVLYSHTLLRRYASCIKTLIPGFKYNFGTYHTFPSPKFSFETYSSIYDIFRQNLWRQILQTFLPLYNFTQQIWPSFEKILVTGKLLLQFIKFYKRAADFP